jgi:hypothetical protein
MHAAIELAGFAAAQAACCLFDRIPLVPLAFSRRSPGAPTVSLLSSRTPAAIAAEALQWLDANVDGAREAVVLFDAFITIPAGRKDAIILDARAYGSRVRQMRLAVPYRPHHDPQGFAVHRPKFVVATPDGHDVEAFRDAFFKGVESHPIGCRVWQACADESW